MSSTWRRVAYLQATRHWATAQWEGHAATKEADAWQKDPPAPVANGFDQVFGRAGRQPGVVPKRPQAQTLAPAKHRANHSSVAPGRRVRVGNGGQPGGRPATGHAAAAHNLPPTPHEANIDIFTVLLKAQSNTQIAINDTNHQNFIAFHMATAQALAAKGSDKDSKLTAAKKRILQACAGDADGEAFAAEPVFRDMDTEGGTLEALGQILRRCLKAIPLSPHKTNIYMTP
jgi:hypothetical protein